MYYVKIFILTLSVLFTVNVPAQVGNNKNLTYPDLADKATLQSLPHITEALAQSIIDALPLKSPAHLNEVLATVLDEKQRTELYGHLFLPLNLNTATREEIMLIPGMNNKMAHEFEEYKPYTNIEHFRREIGKYVNEEAVALMEQYVFVPLNLNSASSGDLTTIPGMSSKMVHEFEEYRPYKNIEQFRSEIGKYVDATEVARLERYVTLD